MQRADVSMQRTVLAERGFYERAFFQVEVKAHPELVCPDHDCLA